MKNPKKAKTVKAEKLEKKRVHAARMHSSRYARFRAERLHHTGTAHDEVRSAAYGYDYETG